ncbi:MAG: diguanylate cyclase [Rhodocyclaceae bacterium]|nr:diguanylate cyclase [Rhodocyclaceae bacterium]
MQDAPPIHWLTIDAQWRVLGGTREFADQFGLRDEHGRIYLLPVLQLQLKQLCAQARQGKPAVAFDFNVVLDEQGTTYALRGWLFAQSSGPAAPVLIVAIIQDCASALLPQQAATMDLLQAVSDAAMVLLPSREVIQCNEALARMLGRDRQEICGQPLAALLPKEELPTAHAALQAAHQMGQWHGLLRFCVNGQPALCEVDLRGVTGGVTAGYLAVVRALFAPTQRHQGLLAESDPVSGLPWRQEGLARMQTILELCARRREAVLVVALKLRDLGQLNERCGVAAVDAWIARLAHTLTAKRRFSDLVFRLSGSVFLLIMPGFASGAVERFLDALRADLSQCCSELLGADAFDLCHLYDIPYPLGTQDWLHKLAATDNGTVA